jgi:hypothetical protein
MLTIVDIYVCLYILLWLEVSEEEEEEKKRKEKKPIG